MILKSIKLILYKHNTELELPTDLPTYQLTCEEEGLVPPKDSNCWQWNTMTPSPITTTFTTTIKCQGKKIIERM